jgi:hypothetical protein
VGGGEDGRGRADSDGEGEGEGRVTVRERKSGRENGREGEGEGEGEGKGKGKGKGESKICKIICCPSVNDGQRADGPPTRNDQLGPTLSGQRAVYSERPTRSWSVSCHWDRAAWF